MAVPRNPVTIDTSDTFSTWLSNTNLAINVLKNIITDTVLTHPSASAFTAGSTITQATTGATGIVQVSTTESTTLSDLGTGTWGTSNDVTQSSPTSVTVSAGDIDAVTVSHLATTNAVLTTPTITAPVIATITNNSNTLTLPTTGDTLVGRATTDTLTNKTLTSPVISGGSMSGLTITNNSVTSAPVLSVDNDGTIGSDGDADAMAISSGGVVTFTQRSVHSAGITVADAGQIGSASDLDAITISAAGDIALTATTANNNATDGALTVAGGLGVALDASIGDDLRLKSDDSVLSFGANDDVLLTHLHNDGLILKNTGSSGGTVLTVQTSNTTVTDGDILGEIDFQAIDDAGGGDAILPAAAIAARSEGDFSSTNNATELVFNTGASEDASLTTTNGKMILSSAGALSANSFKLFGSVNPTPVDFGVVNNSTGFQNAIAGLGTGYGECAAGGRMVASYPLGGELAITFSNAGVYLLCVQMGNGTMGANDVTRVEFRVLLESETDATVVDLGFSGNGDDRIFALTSDSHSGGNMSGSGWYNITATAGQLIQMTPRAEFTTSDDGEDINQKIFTSFMVWG